MALAKLNRLQLLIDLWGKVSITETVFQEAVLFGQAHGAPDALTIRLFSQQCRLPVVTVPDSLLAAYHPAVSLDPGEHATLAYARTLSDVLVLVDDEDARTEARRLGLPIRGTLGGLVQAYRQNLLSFSEVELLINEIAARPDIWISARLCDRVLQTLKSA